MGITRQLTIFDMQDEWRRSVARKSALAEHEGDEERHLVLWEQLAADVGDHEACRLVAAAREELLG